ncbi:helix-turn-helix domain-containing protein [Legionella sp. km772]|uniref:helix-turn-helix domain-containing protein n=1 Tax=Legionella sp. km772 TaxID=2498111 RepID=UPI000F8C920B|nr:helix-turn-helix domain-containing protein [Legionella sp. km772]RUR12818.1 helix-turn-helix domain-containing protein [Legionella sp. km772]
MNTTATMDDVTDIPIENPGIQLAQIRQQKGFSVEYVASKLHLRARIIELIEEGDFNLLPEPVFIKGYLRAYSKLLGVSPEPFLQIFNSQFTEEKKPERALWQSKRESHKAEHFIRWFTIIFALGAMVAIGLWWHNNRDNHSAYSSSTKEEKISQDLSLKEDNTVTEIKLADVSKVQALLDPQPAMSRLENEGE